MQFGNRYLDPAFPQVMGILNVTPDSFSDGGRAYKSVGHALRIAEQMVKDGASIIDIGGESTRPGAAIVSQQEELERVVPVVEAIAARLDVVVSVDTSEPQVISESVKAGAGIINDVRALTRPGAIDATLQGNAAVCLMHMQGDPQNMQHHPNYANVTVEVLAFLQERVSQCVAAGIDRSRLILDPGFGFGKGLEHNVELFRHLDTLAVLDMPLLIGVSRKSMIGQILNKPVDQRLAGSLGLAVMALIKGAWIFRVHDVAETVDALKIAHQVLKV
ncbi:dihydropteroate synthase [Pokkaliibacter plantistimulans]|uniref:Dihydropteroate synthase n=1 Tax=Pokkaliibacter plantistimulans TaxID=1635171 RepID=A0ABX5LVI5_9GAMM|nr:dihydropteroate synthase [Pokkaliibacter plantistimulans]PXF30227.1 dihydropteroate synthase [Pokkaliibacter plantistimulans]